MRQLHLLLLSLILVPLLSGCLEESCSEDRLVTGFEPVIVTADDWRASTFFCGVPQEVCEASSFYVYGDYLFMMENTRGLHIFNNSDPANPTPITFMEVPGGQGLAVRNDILYMNQYVDLVAFRLDDPEQPELVGRTEGVFEPGTVFARVLPDGEYVAEWLPTAEQRVISCNDPRFTQSVWDEGGIFFAGNRNDLALDANFSAPTAEAGGGGGGENVGQGGSLARFTITNGTLYAVDERNLKTFDLSDPERPQFIGNVGLDWGIETLFPYGNQLYVGSATGVHIYDVSDPLNPEHLSTFEHVLACDPVVVHDDLAYVTLWGGRDCGSVGDQLEIIDVSDPRNPTSVQITPMSSSHGLGVAEGKLFLCSQWEGFRVFDLDDEGLLGEQLDHVDDVTARDVIVQPGINNLIVLGYYQDGIKQYHYTDRGQLSRSSEISVCR